MKILIDADGCPVVDLTAALAKKYKIECLLLCDTSHVFQKDGVETVTVSKGADSVDFALVNRVVPGDIVITQDYGLAAMCLARRAVVLSQDGMEYTPDNIDALLLQRHTARKIRAAGGRLKGPKKRSPEQDAAFGAKLSALLASPMERYEIIRLNQRPQLKQQAAAWFHDKWNVPLEAYLESMDASLSGDRVQRWYLCLDGETIIAGMGEIENDFHDRKDLTPNICAVFTLEEYRRQGIAGRLLDFVVADNRQRGLMPLYLITNHTGFYERYGWAFLCMVQGDGEPEMTRMYIHK